MTYSLFQADLTVNKDNNTSFTNKKNNNNIFTDKNSQKNSNSVSNNRQKLSYPIKDEQHDQNTVQSQQADQGWNPRRNMTVPDSRRAISNELSNSELRIKNEKKAAIFKSKYNKSFDYGNSYYKGITQKGNDLVFRNQNLTNKKPKKMRINEMSENSLKYEKKREFSKKNI